MPVPAYGNNPTYLMRDPSTPLALPHALKEQGRTAFRLSQVASICVSKTQAGLLNSNGVFVSQRKQIVRKARREEQTKTITKQKVGSITFPMLLGS